MSALQTYFHDLTHESGAAWNRFWFTPRDPHGVCLLRILVGLLAIYYVLSHTADLKTWFGPAGILNSETVTQLTDAGGLSSSFRYTYLRWAGTPTALWLLHGAGAVVVLCFVLGIWSRLTSMGALVVVLAYVHRAPLLTGQFEPVLTMLLAYLCLAPTGRCWSVDAWRAGNRPADASLGANIATRLLQIHTAGFCLLIGLNMLAADTWWTGEAFWWLMTRSESRLLDLTAVFPNMFFVNAWTHATVAYLLVFGVLVWSRLPRPLLLVLGIPVWTGLAVVTGQVAWCVAMVVASLVFLDDAQMRKLTRQPGGNADVA